MIWVGSKLGRPASDVPGLQSTPEAVADYEAVARVVSPLMPNRPLCRTIRFDYDERPPPSCGYIREHAGTELHDVRFFDIDYL